MDPPYWTECCTSYENAGLAFSSLTTGSWFLRLTRDEMEDGSEKLVSRGSGIQDVVVGTIE